MPSSPFKKVTLQNGLRVILVPQPSSLSSAVLVLVEAGSEYEKKHLNGISHFLEHLTFKGTKKRPKPGTISRQLDALGAEYNAFTGQEYTGYWAKAQKHKLPQILEIVSDLYLNPIFNAKEIDKERGVVIEELNMYEDTPMRRVHDFFMQLLYGDQPAGWDVGGRKEVIRKLTRGDFVEYRSAHYVAPATVVVVAGAFREQSILRQVKELFGHLKREPKGKRAKTRERQTKPGIFVKYKKTDQSHLVLGVRACDIFDNRRYALQVLSDVLGGGMSSRLFHRIREILGAAYYIKAGTDLFLDHGYINVWAGADNKRASQVVEAVMDELRRLRTDLVPPDELKKAKEHMVGNFIMSLETPDEMAGYFGGQEVLTRRTMKPEDLAKKIQGVRAEEIRKVARSFFRNDRLNFAIIGPYRDAARFTKIVRF